MLQNDSGKFVFNPESLTFSKENEGFDFYLKKISQYFSLSLVFGLVGFVLLISFFDLPKIQFLKYKNKALLSEFSSIRHKTNEMEKVLEVLAWRDNELYRPVFETASIPNTVRKAGFGGTDRYPKISGFSHNNLVNSTKMSLDIVSKEIYVQSKSYDQLIQFIRNKEKMLKCFPAIQPVKKSDITGFCPFGLRVNPITGVSCQHKGVDLCGKLNTPIYATGDGKVIRVHYHFSLGNFIIIDHGFGFKSVYGHLNKVLVKTGQKVVRGQEVALMGTTGLSEVVHIHYEIYKDEKQVDPVNYYYNDLTDDEYVNLIEKSKSTQYTGDHVQTGYFE